MPARQNQGWLKARSSFSDTPLILVRTREPGSRSLVENTGSGTLNLQMRKLKLKMREGQQVSSRARVRVREPVAPLTTLIGLSSLAEDSQTRAVL